MEKLTFDGTDKSLESFKKMYPNSEIANETLVVYTGEVYTGITQDNKPSEHRNHIIISKGQSLIVHESGNIEIEY